MSALVPIEALIGYVEGGALVITEHLPILVTRTSHHLRQLVRERYCMRVCEIKIAMHLCEVFPPSNVSGVAWRSCG